MRHRKRGVIAGAALTIVIAAVTVGWSIAASPYAPEQPVDFHHRDHVTSDQLDCELCHSGVRRSPFAGMPPVEQCIGCHRVVVPQHPEVAKLRRYYDEGKAVSWIKVYSVPRFVRFSHEAHTLARVRCETCHGDVASMNRVARVTPLTMGWCVGCHRRSGASDDCLTCHY